MPSAEYIPYREICRQIGIEDCKDVVLASDITRLAFTAMRNEGSFDIDVLMDSFTETIGSKGTLIIPAYNHNLPRKCTFDIKNTQPVTGALAEAALAREDYTRTRHPLHSFLVKGTSASNLTGLKNVSSFGSDSPFSYLYEKDATMVMLGTTVTDAFTFTHFVEESFQVKYRKYTKYAINYIEEDGSSTMKNFLLYRKKRGWTMALDRLENNLLDGILEKFTCNGVDIYKISLKAAYDIIYNDLQQNNARNIARFSMNIYLRDIVKSILGALGMYKSVSNKFDDGSGVR